MAFLEPIILNHDGTILDGYALWRLANSQGRKMLRCFEHELSEVDALEFFLLRRQGPNHLNDFIRISLALDLEPFLRDKATTHDYESSRRPRTAYPRIADPRFGLGASPGTWVNVI